MYPLKTGTTVHHIVASLVANFNFLFCEENYHINEQYISTLHNMHATHSDGDLVTLVGLVLFTLTPGELSVFVLKEEPESIDQSNW